MFCYLLFFNSKDVVLMMLSIQFCLWVSCYSKLWALGLWNVIINSWLGVSSAKHNNSLQRKQRSQSLERARSPSYRGDQRAESLPPPWSGSGSGAAFISDPDMLASKLAEQEYLQGLGNWWCPYSASSMNWLFVCFRPSQKCQQPGRHIFPAVVCLWWSL